MDLHPLDWAYSQTLRPSTKFVLVTMAKVARPDYFCAVSTLCDLTGLNEKTVRASLSELQSLGLISDTGRRTGKTRQIIVFELSTVDTQKRKASKNGRLPLFPVKVPKNGIRRKVPKNGIRSKELRYKKENRDVSHQKSQNIPTNRPRNLTEIMDGLKIATKGKA